MSDLPDSDILSPLAPQKRRRRRHSGPLGRIRRRLRRVHWPLVFAVVIVVAALAVVGALVLATDARSRIESAASSVQRVLGTISATPGTRLTLTDFDRLQASVNDLAGAVARADAQTRLLRPLAALNPDWAAQLGLLDAGRSMTTGGQAMLEGLRPTLFSLVSGREDTGMAVQAGSGGRVVELLALGRGRFLEAQQRLQEARLALDGLALDSVSPDLLLLSEQLSRYQRDLLELSVLLAEAPDLLTSALGLDERQNILVLAQNSDELRPSGGYISTYGWLLLDDGRVVDYNYYPTTETSPNPPPASLAASFAPPAWWIRYGQPVYAAWDGSWYADFPSTAAMSAWFYDGGDNPRAPVDSVIAIDLVGFEYLLDGLGSVTVPEYHEVVTPENFRALIYAIRGEGAQSREHKRFLAALYRQIMADWQRVDREQGAQMFGAVLRALQEKHIMLFFKDERLERLVDALNWSGAQLPGTANDYLMVADANLGSKSNRSISRALTYDVAIGPDGALESRLTVAYDFPASVAEADPAVRPEHYNQINYYNLMQVFVPAGSTLTAWNNLPRQPVIVSTETHTIFVSTVEVPYNSGERFQFSYTSPPLVETVGQYRRYRLAIQKQAGMIGEPVSVQVSLPPGARLVGTTPAVATSYNVDRQVLEFRLTLTTDQWIEVIYTLPE